MPRRIASRPPNVFDFEDYREYLRAWFRFRKSGARGYSFGVFAKRAGTSSRSHLKLVMDGRRNLGPAMVERYVHGLSLAGEEARCFRALVRWCQARTEVERETARGDLHRIRTLHGTRRLEAGEAEGLIRQWEAMMVLSMTTLKGFRPDPAWIVRRTRGRISREGARAAVGWLRRNGYFARKRGRERGAGRHGSMEFPEIPRERSGRLLRWIAREVAVPDRPARFGDANFMMTVITPPEAERLREGFWRWLQENVPDHSRRPVDGELCVILGDILPLTLRAGR